MTRKPSADRTDKALLDFAAVVLEDFFMDVDKLDRYKVVARGGRKAGAKTGEPIDLGTVAYTDGARSLWKRAWGRPESN